MDANEKVIVVGASAGGIEAFLQLASGLDPALPAAICFVVHISRKAPSMFATNLSRKSPFRALFPQDGEPMARGHIYLAPPDRHMVISDGKLRLVHGPRENWTRPAIDPLFRSAAAYYRNRTIGVLLTGLLDDGSDGLRAIKRCGGVTVVQEPTDAAFPDMPQNAIYKGRPDHVTPLRYIPQLLRELATAPLAGSHTAPEVPEELLREVRFLEQGAVAYPYPAQEWTGSGLACPECGGPLWQKREEGGSYGCTVGHRFGPQTLMAVQNDAIEQSLWVALRTLQERGKVQRQLADGELRRGNDGMALMYRNKALESEQHAARLKDLLLQIPKDEANEAEGAEGEGAGSA
jgi:two-component system chemotaxis response regulator CheB